MSLKKISSHILCAVALVTLVVSMPAKQAEAQLDIQSVVVLDFDVTPGLDPMLGRKAADALAVELQTSTANERVPRQRIEVVSRALVDKAKNDVTALQPPYTDIIQMRLARAVGASSVWSGKVLSAVVGDDKQAARVALEVRRLDAASGIYINGAIVSQLASATLDKRDVDLLIDESINKSVYAGIIAIDRKPLPQGTVQIVTRNGRAYINLGVRQGAERGQKYAILRDIYRGRDVTDRDVVERVKVGELVITSIDGDQSTGIITAHGESGIRTGDKVLRMYVPTELGAELFGADRRRLKYLTPDEEMAYKAAFESRIAESKARQQAMEVKRAEQIGQRKKTNLRRRIERDLD